MTDASFVAGTEIAVGGGAINCQLLLLEPEIKEPDIRACGVNLFAECLVSASYDHGRRLCPFVSLTDLLL